jgi:hypothetical protein
MPRHQAHGVRRELDIGSSRCSLRALTVAPILFRLDRNRATAVLTLDNPAAPTIV